MSNVADSETQPCKVQLWNFKTTNLTEGIPELKKMVAESYY